MNKTQREAHGDIFGTKLEVGDIVVVATGRQSVAVAKVTKITPKSVRVIQYDGEGQTWNGHDRCVPTRGVVKVEGEDALAFVLKNA